MQLLRASWYWYQFDTGTRSYNCYMYLDYTGSLVGLDVRNKTSVVEVRF